MVVSVGGFVVLMIMMMMIVFVVRFLMIMVMTVFVVGDMFLMIMMMMSVAGFMVMSGFVVVMIMMIMSVFVVMFLMIMVMFVVRFVGVGEFGIMFRVIMIMMTVFVARFVPVVRPVPRRLGIPVLILGQVIRPAFQFDQGVGAADAPPFIPEKADIPASYPQLAQLPPKGLLVHPQVYQGAQGHVAGNAGETVKMQCFHA
jgi:hypothetical protein